MAQIIDQEEGIPPRKKRKEDADIDITPMIDIVFLLLAFFVIVSKMDPAAAVQLPRARYGESIPAKSCVVLVVGQSAGGDPIVYKGSSQDKKDQCTGDVEEITEEIVEYVEQELRVNADYTTVLIKAEKEVKSRHVSMVKEAVSQVINEKNGPGDQSESIYKIYVGIEEE